MTIHVVRTMAMLATAGWLLVPAAYAAKPGDRMPSLPPIENLDKKAPPVDFGRFKGQVLYVDFWASWCVPCRESMPVVDELYRKLGPRGFAVVGVNKDDRVVDAQRFLGRVPVTFPLVSDGDDVVAKAFLVGAMPSGYLFDRKGVVRKVHLGYTAQSARLLEREVEGLLREAP